VEAMMYWPGYGQVGWDELVLRHLLPLAAEGLARRKVAGTVVDRFLGIIEARCKLHRNGAWWQTETVTALEEAGMDREQALTEMLRRYMDGMHSNEPVHTWRLPGGPQRRGPRRSRARQQALRRCRRSASAASAPNRCSSLQATTCATPDGMVCWQPGQV